MFFDEAKINVKAGDGGDGCIAFRREWGVPFGGPNGGNGGAGGDVYLVVDPHLNTLISFKERIHFKAEQGGRGSGRNQQGKSGADRLVPVPSGTVVYDADTDEFLGDLVQPGQRLLVAQGGRGGRGNATFASPTRQVPRYAEHGEPGLARWLRLELKLIADAGIVGMPNSGKSTLLSVVSAARPKIADYAFTTLQPNLGVVTVDGIHSFVLADMPGLIEGASQGAGLGHQFLRHVERTRLLIHLLDGSGPDPLADYRTINRELAQFSERLSARPQIVALSKMDLPDAREQWPLVQAAMRELGVEACAISAATGQGVRELVARTYELLCSLPRPSDEEAAPSEPSLLRPAEREEAFTLEKDGDAWRIRGVRVERIAAMTPFGVPEAAARFQRQLQAMGVVKALETAGVKPGDLVRIGERELEWQG
jgi:GTP-binding protein